MKIGILSDLHMDVHPYTPAVAPDCRVVIVAGDTCSRLDHGLPWMAEQVRQRGMELIYVPGNHDWYANRTWGDHTCTIDGDEPKARALAAQLGIHLLIDGEAVVIGGVRFVGATLWSDYEVFGDAKRSRAAAAAHMTDHKVIKIKSGGYTKWRTSDHLATHRRHLERLGEILETPFDGPTVVVTHHAPHPRSLLEGRSTEPLDGSYASDLSDFIERHRPSLWVHGHVHRQQDYRIGETRIVANPRGYVVTKEKGTKREWVEVENPDHDPGFAVELGR
ncbi:phosphatase [Methylopila jiangsuensis]|uniref:Phosphatase n=1 Tax=Methylopila jiangsuensis TaxID=586230 RepID=A0A9W6N271_9HYPH|nr:metallophosphoesterase family protein [Methylopila jiangsuensis]MDR6287340.1 Icc-related predicted phosphoesterase [Methylopila jiangsuensis]GLK74921.1 phosphatase [Methylopila jiangsuensis]